MREERSLVRDPLYTAVGEVAVTERTPEVSWRSVLQEDVETSVHLCWRCCSYRPHPACPHCADLVNRPSKRGFTQDTGCVLTLPWRYWLVALRSISPHTLRSASRCFLTWDNHKENWQCHSCSVISVIQPAAALLTKTVHSAAYYKKSIRKVWACTHLFQFPCTFLYLCRWQINLNLNLQAVTATDPTVL